jgi:putative acetyltransferase
MGVRPGWRGCGIGHALLTCLLEWAVSTPEIEKVTLAVRADNHPAIALYKKHGFVLSGCDKDYLKLSDGSFVDDLRMERFVR